MITVAINGFGRIGKLLFRMIMKRDDVRVGAINCSIPVIDLPTYLEYDSVHGREIFEFDILDESNVRINGQLVGIVNSRDPSSIDWTKYGIDVVIEATGKFREYHKAAQHACDKIIITAPADEEVPIFCYGVNHEQYKDQHVISAGSCTTNCVAPLLHSIHQHFVMDQVNFLTVHSSTQSQPILDRASRKRADRSVLNNIIPYTTGASDAVRRLIPDLSNIYGAAVRVPTSDVSMVDIVIHCPEKVYLSDVLNTIRSSSLYGKVFYIQNEGLVSSDYRGNQVPCIVDGPASEQLSPKSIRIVMWYDNEISYCAQLLSLLQQPYAGE